MIAHLSSECRENPDGRVLMHLVLIPSFIHLFIHLPSFLRCQGVIRNKKTLVLTLRKQLCQKQMEAMTYYTQDKEISFKFNTKFKCVLIFEAELFTFLICPEGRRDLDILKNLEGCYWDEVERGWVLEGEA